MENWTNSLVATNEDGCVLYLDPVEVCLLIFKKNFVVVEEQYQICLPTGLLMDYCGNQVTEIEEPLT